MDVDGGPRVAGPDVVDVHAVRGSAGSSETRRHERLTRDVSTDDVVSRIVQLRREEVVFVDPFDFKGGDNVGQARRSVCHLRIMP